MSAGKQTPSLPRMLTKHSFPLTQLSSSYSSYILSLSDYYIHITAIIATTTTTTTSPG
jgi:hypothetical protein